MGLILSCQSYAMDTLVDITNLHRFIVELECEGDKKWEQVRELTVTIGILNGEEYLLPLEKLNHKGTNFKALVKTHHPETPLSQNQSWSFVILGHHNNKDYSDLNRKQVLNWTESEFNSFIKNPKIIALWKEKTTRAQRLRRYIRSICKITESS